jgi:hypothetical protein
MTLKEIYIRALADNITGKEAAAKYHCRYDSLMKKGAHYKMPPLKKVWSEFDDRMLDSIGQNKLLIYKKKLEEYLTTVNNHLQKYEHKQTN